MGPVRVDRPTLLRAVLDGQCCDVATSGTSHAGDLLRAVRPQHFLSLGRHSVDSPVFRIAVDHYQETTADRRNRSAIFTRLVRLDARYKKVQRAAAFRRGESGSTAPWQNTAREIAAIHGPCWLAAEIAIIGAASQGTRTGGSISKGGTPGGAGLDYGVFVQQVRASRSSPDWWSNHYAAYADELSRRTWALALVAVADEAVVCANLAALDTVLTGITVDALRATADSSSRIGASGIGRRLPTSILADARDCSARTLLLLCHHTVRLRDLDTLASLPMTALIDMLAIGPARWPALRALTARMLASPSPELLDALRTAGPHATVEVPSTATAPDGQFLAEVLSAPAQYPLNWVIAAERWHSQHHDQPPLARVATRNGWVPDLSH